MAAGLEHGRLVGMICLALCRFCLLLLCCACLLRCSRFLSDCVALLARGRDKVPHLALLKLLCLLLKTVVQLAPTASGPGRIRAVVRSQHDRRWPMALPGIVAGGCVATNDDHRRPGAGPMARAGLRKLNVERNIGSDGATKIGSLLFLRTITWNGLPSSPAAGPWPLRRPAKPHPTARRPMATVGRAGY